MGYVNRIQPCFPSQGRIASHGGLMHRACALFTAAYIQFPPPPFPEHSASTLEQFGLLCLALLLLFALVLMALPGKWSQRVIRIAFCIKKERQ